MFNYSSLDFTAEILHFSLSFNCFYWFWSLENRKFCLSKNPKVNIINFIDIFKCLPVVNNPIDDFNESISIKVEPNFFSKSNDIP
jgi:hypothetical protein